MPKKQFYKLLLKMGLILIFAFSGLVLAESSKPSGGVSIQVRDDGLTLAVRPLPEKEQKQPYQYLTMIIKTGSAHDPAAKSGLTTLTNELLYLFFYNSSALQVDLNTAPDFSIIHFVVANSDYDTFINELDGIIRLEALTMYDQCNELILAHQNEPIMPGYNTAIKLAELLYGPSHPYRCGLTPNFKQLNITDVNNWFRKIYRPNNLIVASSKELPEAFLRRPSGRDMKSPVNPPEIPPAKGSSASEVVFNPVRDNVSTIRIGFSAPKISEADFFPALMARKYLEKELWQAIREESGYCYDLQVAYSYLPNSAAPDLEISFQTLPSETDRAVLKTLAVLELATNKEMPMKILPEILEREELLEKYRDQSGLQLVRNAAFQAFTSQKWPGDSGEYLAKLSEVKATDISRWIAAGLPRIKIAIAGPVEVEKQMGKIREKVKAMGVQSTVMPKTTPAPKK
jgi:predicted Zn-dependent peptidase